jgi:transcriptional regulator
MEFCLKDDGNGGLKWVWGSVRKQIKEAVLGLLEEGRPQKEIAKELGVTEGRVSQIRRELDRKGKIWKRPKT